MPSALLPLHQTNIEKWFMLLLHIKQQQRTAVNFKIIARIRYGYSNRKTTRATEAICFQ